MHTNKNTKKAYLKAQKKVYHLKVFYIHLAGYIVLATLLLYNLFTTQGPHAHFFFWFDSIVLVAWTGFIIIHGWHVFKGPIVFKKAWEARKIQEFLNKENTKRWE